MKPLISEAEISQMIDDWQRRGELARLAGGIPKSTQMEQGVANSESDQ